ncbi:hypothetical protein ACFYU5_14205 [Nocardia aobensis]|uniref:Uncharacterized protein n=1 Tax=Nocardia aobensis TaxID=257277 RepID=A0ABW6P475_9NOCA
MAAGTLSETTSAVADLTGRPATTFAEFLDRKREALRHWPPRLPG